MMYYLVEFTEDNIYEICSQRDIKGRRQKFCLAKWQFDKNFYPAKILVSGTKQFVRNLFDNLNNGLPKVLLFDVRKLLAQTDNNSYEEQENISKEEDVTNYMITASNLMEEELRDKTHPVTVQNISKDGVQWIV